MLLQWSPQWLRKDRSQRARPLGTPWRSSVALVSHGAVPLLGTLLWLATACGSGSSATNQGDDQDGDGGRPLTATSQGADNVTPGSSGQDETADPTPPESSGMPPVIEGDEPILVIDMDGGADGLHCEREVTFEAVELGPPEPFDVVIVADHSDSISWSRDELAAGLSSLLDDVQGYDARFYVLTPTQYGVSAALAVNMSTGDDLVAWRDPVTGAPYERAVTNYVQTCTDAFGQPRTCPAYPAREEAFSLEGHFEFSMPEPVATLTREMTDTELEAQKQQLVAGILELGGQASPVEQPVCTLNRYLRQPSAQLPEHAVFVVISDEDDVSSPSDCIERYSYEWGTFAGERQNTGCTEQCDFWRTWVRRSGPSRTLSFDCVPVDDFGTTYPDQGFGETSPGVSTTSCEGQTTECSAGDLASAEIRCDTGYVVENCSATCNESGSSATCGLDLTDGSVDACTDPFEYDGVQYENLIAMCEQQRGTTGWTDCQREGVAVEESESWASSTARSPLVVAGDVLDMIRAFQVEALNTFGEDGFYVATVVFDERFDCEMQAGQSNAATLRMLAAGPDDVFPICESYAPVLQKVSRFAQKLLATEYVVELESRESIESITVEDSSAQVRELDADQYDYDAETSTLQIEPSALSGADQHLSVSIVDPCARRVR